MTALATLIDYEDITGRSADSRVTRLLDVASATVRRYTGQTLSLVEDDEITVTPSGGVVRLPQRPVTEITSIERQGVTLDPATYTWTRQGIVTGPDNLNRFDLDLCWGCLPLTVTYSHGYDPVPDDIIAAVVAQAARGVNSTQGVRQETIGGYSVTYGTDGLTDDERSTLDAYRTVVGRIDTYPSWA